MLTNSQAQEQDSHQAATAGATETESRAVLAGGGNPSQSTNVNLQCRTSVDRGRYVTELNSTLCCWNERIEAILPGLLVVIFLKPSWKEIPPFSVSWMGRLTLSSSWGHSLSVIWTHCPLEEGRRAWSVVPVLYQWQYTLVHWLGLEPTGNSTLQHKWQWKMYGIKLWILLLYWAKCLHWENELLKMYVFQQLIYICNWKSRAKCYLKRQNGGWREKKKNIG